MADTTPNIALVVLAAGASSRMGSPKQLLKWGNTTLVEYAINTAKATSANKVFVVLGAHQNRIAKVIQHHSVSILNNKKWEDGLGTSIACASEFILNSNENSKENFDGILIMLADQPFVSSDFLNRLIGNFILDTKSIIATSYGKNKYGVPSLFDASYLKELSNLNTDFGARELLKKHKNSIKTVLPDFENLDIDTKEDYQYLKSKNIKD